MYKTLSLQNYSEMYSKGRKCMCARQLSGQGRTQSVFTLNAAGQPTYRHDNTRIVVVAVGQFAIGRKGEKPTW